MPFNNEYPGDKDLIRLSVALKIISTSLVLGVIVAIMICTFLGELNITIVLTGAFVGMLHGGYALRKIATQIGLVKYHQQIKHYLKKSEY